MIKRADSAFLVSSESPAAIGMTLAAIGRDRPVVYDEFMAAPLVLRHQDVSRALRDGATFSTEFYGGQPDGGGDGRAQRRGARSAANLETQRRTKRSRTEGSAGHR